MTRALVMLSLLLSCHAHSAEYSSVQPDRSSITFVSRQMNVPVEGTFRKFDARIRFDPARPETGNAQIDIDLSGIDAGSEEANDEARGKQWFNVLEFPKASFSSSSVRPLGNGRFEASGRMTLKGKTLKTRATFTFKQENGTLSLDGAFPLKRLDYAIGSGIWGDTSIVADEVQVRFHFVLK